jgi:type II secretory pathway pseudopilin PulG
VADRPAQRRQRDQRGLTLIEAVLALVIVVVAIISIAGGLLVSARVDNFANETQRANLALQTFVENLEYRPPGANPCGVGAGAPVSAPGVSNPPSHAGSIMTTALGADEVQEWIDRGMLFRITDLQYASVGTGPGAETFSPTCPTPPAPEDPFYPVVRLEVEACLVVDTTRTDCDDAVGVVADAVLRGGRTGS